MLEIILNKQFFSHVFKNVHPWQTDQPQQDSNCNCQLLGIVLNYFGWLGGGGYVVVKEKILIKKFNLN